MVETRISTYKDHSRTDQEFNTCAERANPTAIQRPILRNKKNYHPDATYAAIDYAIPAIDSSKYMQCAVITEQRYYITHRLKRH